MELLEVVRDIEKRVAGHFECPAPWSNGTQWVRIVPIGTSKTLVWELSYGGGSYEDEWSTIRFFVSVEAAQAAFAEHLREERIRVLSSTPLSELRWKRGKEEGAIDVMDSMGYWTHGVPCNKDLPPSEEPAPEWKEAGCWEDKSQQFGWRWKGYKVNPATGECMFFSHDM